jgi:GntR family transcriptional regulator, transcriptional repressor for pyruvate dehydrogenase complex
VVCTSPTTRCWVRRRGAGSACPPTSTTSVEEHAAIYRAIRDGAADAAGVHMDKIREDYRREIQRHVFGDDPDK